jgi:phenylalanyl-tRNA synthetase beta chain
MKFSEQWLRAWVNPDCTTQELAHRLTMAGLEVDAIEPVAGDFEKVVVGEVLVVEPHPDADKLRVCTVDIGKAEPLQIVCGAANVAEGMKVPTALIGAKLPGDFKIKKSKLRGVESFGMLCSEQELGMAESAEGLLPLAGDARPGQDIRDYLDLNDVSIELGLTPNRGDCLGVAGIARETGVLFDCTVNEPDTPAVTAAINDTFPVDVQAHADCPRYLGRVIRGINPRAETPLWMQERLRRSGLRSLGPVVDITNYVLLELGQPMHAFDLAKLQGGLWVRRAVRNESLTLLDGNKVTLDPDTLVIADVRGPQALAGIMGGEASAVSDSTNDIFLECAYFAPLPIAGRARYYGLHTDSSHRFERGIDPDLQQRAIERATALLLEIVGGQAGPVNEVVSAADIPARPEIRLRSARINKVLGTGIENGEIERILGQLGMQVASVAAGEWSVRPPSFRFDITIEEDLIEEVGRIHGYDRLPTRHGRGELVMAPRTEMYVPLRRLRSRLVDRGYQEAITYSFIDPALQERFANGQPVIRLANPIASDMAVMRTSLWPGLISALQFNRNRQQERVLLFESGIKYLLQDNDIKEKMFISGIACGPWLPEQWGSESRRLDYFDIKADVEALLVLAAPLGEWEFRPAENPVLHPGQCADICRNGVVIGQTGALHPALAAEFDLPEGVFLFEMALDALQQATLPSFAEVSRYPAIRRDLAIVVKASITSQEVGNCVREAAGDWLTKLQLFDVYSGKGIDSGEKSLALGLTLQASSRTLTDMDVEGVVENVLTALQRNFDATLRE